MPTTSKPANTPMALLKKVEKAFETLEKAGRKPTVEGIRGEIGGSYTKLCPAVRIVRERRAEDRRQAEAAPEMPDEVREIFETAWVQAHRVADEHNVAARKSFAEEIARKETEIEEREAALFNLEAENEKLERDLGAAQKIAHEAELRATKLEGLLGQRERDVEIANAKLEERDAILTPLFFNNFKANERAE
ncbi:DNA-binding protein [Antarcticimicrobium sediminis]|uniref:KfrA N-terminal DNA-binding domain-containing protein n=1 Tax=Antarcticimicrobium sediminis TaxID=2546227 RepID=A0A4R5ENL5_9RHOB|nr:DNA-binding protein [Antarcticimicrobium sediminis]TDE36321.1 hypothetical protein E1B25_15545 [Antarcticimicrobium sediminis]